MIYYHPHSISENPSKGSELRPKKMKEAFQNIGYTVDLVAGNSLQRKKAIKNIKSEIKKGVYYNFLYAESSNMPIPLADTHHFPIRLLLDYNFFRFLNQNNIPIGFFYRDLYWRVDELKKKVSYLKFIPKQAFHWLEWYGVAKTVNHLFVPTKSMAKYFPTDWPEERFSALYPGCEPVSSKISKINYKNNKLKLFYVGGVKPPYYDLTPLIKTVNELDGFDLTLCCRQKDWEVDSHYYSHLNFDQVNIVHANSSEIVKFYMEADIFFDIRKPEGYLQNTIPIKVIESLGYEVPLLLMDGTEAADFVKRENAGWIVENIYEAKKLLNKLRKNRDKIVDKVNHIGKINKKHTWKKRAEKAGGILKNSAE